jgi:hypothetical protein
MRCGRGHELYGDALTASWLRSASAETESMDSYHMLYFVDKGVQGKKMGFGVLGEGNKLLQRGDWTWEGNMVPSVFGSRLKMKV